MGGLERVARIHAQVGEGDRFERLGLGLHDVRQLDEARLVQAQVGGDDGRQVDFQRLQSGVDLAGDRGLARSEEHTSELQSLMRISYAVFCLKKKHTITKNKIRKLTGTDKRIAYKQY